LLPQLERRFEEFIWIKKIIPCKCHLPLATIDNKKGSNEDQQKPTCTSVLTRASNFERLFHSHQNLVEISWCSMDDAHYTMQFPIGKRRWML
jgi:hypothetical protein